MRHALTLLFACALAGCAIFQPQHVRDQRQYERYIRHSMKERDKRERLIRQEQAAQLPPPQETAPPQVYMSVNPG